MLNSINRIQSPKTLNLNKYEDDPGYQMTAQSRIEQAKTEKIIHRAVNGADSSSAHLNDIGDINYSSNEIAGFQPYNPPYAD